MALADRNNLRGTPILKGLGGGCSSYLSGARKAFLVPFRVFSLQRSPVGIFAGPHRVLNEQKKHEIMLCFRIDHFRYIKIQRGSET